AQEATACSGLWTGDGLRQRRALPSSLPVRIIRSPAPKATAQTLPWCGSGGPRGRPVAASHRRAVPSQLPVTTPRLAWLKDAARASWLWASGWPTGRPGAGRPKTAVPQAGRPVQAPCQDPSAVEAEGGYHHLSPVGHRESEALAGGGVPQTGCPIPTGR